MATTTDVHTLSETALAANLAEVLDRVRAGERFVIEREGEVVATLGPPPPRGATWAEIAARPRDVPPPDEDFAKDVEKIQSEQGILGEDVGSRQTHQVAPTDRQ